MSHDLAGGGELMRPPGIRSACPCTAQIPLRFLSGFSQETFSEHSANSHRTPIEHSGSSQGGEASKARSPARPIVYVAELFPGFQHPTFQNKNARRPLPNRRAFSLPAHSSTHGTKEKSHRHHLVYHSRLKPGKPDTLRKNQLISAHDM